MNAQHTLGPWELDAESEIVSGFDRYGERQVVVYELGTNEANNHLIVAAPDLLAALEDALKDLDALSQWDNASACARKARAAIARARGE